MSRLGLLRLLILLEARAQSTSSSPGLQRAGAQRRLRLAGCTEMGTAGLLCSPGLCGFLPYPGEPRTNAPTTTPTVPWVQGSGRCCHKDVSLSLALSAVVYLYVNLRFTGWPGALKPAWLKGFPFYPPPILPIWNRESMPPLSFSFIRNSSLKRASVPLGGHDVGEPALSLQGTSDTQSQWIPCIFSTLHRYLILDY